ncbi:hypothetical protein KA005_83050 [bacterium]|nr:hypothetical protein [bacterium]
MGVRKIVFGSKEERKYYKKLTNTWENKLNIYHNLPFLSVFTGREPLIDTSGLEIFELNDSEYDLLKKTSIDYVICNKKDEPLLCIDFDGLQGGFNIGRTYVVPKGKGNRKGRRAIFELKLRVAHGSLFPYFILGSEQFKGLSDSVYLTIADGLIGEVLATKARIEERDSGFDPTEYGYSEEEFEDLDEITKRNIIEDWAIGIEVESDYKHNPIFQKVADIYSETESKGHSIMFLNEADTDPEVWTWVECEVTNHKYGNEKAKVYLPNFQTPFCYFSVHLAQEIAKLLALEKIRKRIKAFT